MLRYWDTARQSSHSNQSNSKKAKHTMSAPIGFTITSAGLAASINAISTGFNVEITHIQTGSGNRIPDGTETALVTPEQLTTIAVGSRISPSQIRMSAVFSGSSAYNVKEVGIWAGDPNDGGILWAYWSQVSGTLHVKTTEADYTFTYDMALDPTIGNSITIIEDSDYAVLATLIQAHEQIIIPTFSVVMSNTNGLSIAFPRETWTKVPWEYKQIDSHNWFSSSKFTPQWPGYYQINAVVNIFNSEDSHGIIMALYKNGIRFRKGNSSRMSSTNASFPVGSSLSTVVSANGISDYFEIYAYHDNNNDNVFNSNPDESSFSGFYIGPAA